MHNRMAEFAVSPVSSLPWLTNKYQINQEAGTLACSHCPFRCLSQISLSRHEEHHSMQFQFKCCKCTYSAKNVASVKKHIIRVHCVRSSIPLESQTAALKERRTSGRKKASEEPMDAYNEEEVTCICKEPNGNSFMICCDECDDWFHGECVQVTPTLANQLDIIGYEWICPRCVDKQSPMNHTSKLVKAMTEFAQQLESAPLESTGNVLVVKLTDLSNQSEMQTAVPHLKSDRKSDEEKRCMMELDQLAKDFQAAHSSLLQTAETKKVEAQLIQKNRAAHAAELCRKMEELTMINGELSTELADLKEQKQRIEQQLKMETSQKIHAERELFHLRDAVSKIKQERCVQSDPFEAMKEFEAPLWQKNKLLFSSDGKLQQHLKEEAVLIGRIQSLEEKLSENAQKMLGISAPLPEPESIAGAQMQFLKEEQGKRIDRIAQLEKRLVELNREKILDDISRKGEKWLAALM